VWMDLYFIVRYLFEQVKSVLQYSQRGCRINLFCITSPRSAARKQVFCLINLGSTDSPRSVEFTNLILILCSAYVQHLLQFDLVINTLKIEMCFMPNGSAYGDRKGKCHEKGNNLFI
jgi:hypothetical protein